MDNEKIIDSVHQLGINSMHYAGHNALVYAYQVIQIIKGEHTWEYFVDRQQEEYKLQFNQKGE
jgi:hypothetical protein